MDTAKQAQVQRLVDLWYLLGNRGLAWEQVPPQDVEAQRALLAARPARLSLPHLRQIQLAWDRWGEAKPHGAPLFQPSPTQLGIFLQGEAKRGATVASSRMRGFRWLHKHLGLPFPVASPLLKDFLQPADGHTPQQAQCLSPEDFVNILALVRQKPSHTTTTTSIIPAKLVLLACISCVRCKHFARSSLQAASAHMLSAFCSKGKAIRRGSRPPYTWAIPLLPELGDECFEFLTSMLEKWQRPPFLVPAFRTTSSLGRFTARRWQQKPMIYRHWILLLKQVAQHIGWEKDALRVLSFNSMRRFMPTLASVLRFPTETAQAIGHWQDTPIGESGSSSSLRIMSVHYSDQKALASAQAKRQVLQCFFSLISSHPAAAAALSGGPPLPRGALSWEHIALLQHQHATITAPTPTTSPAIHHKRDRKDKEAKRARKAEKKRNRERETPPPNPRKRARPS